MSAEELWDLVLCDDPCRLRPWSRGAGFDEAAQSRGDDEHPTLIDNAREAVNDIG